MNNEPPVRIIFEIKLYLAHDTTRFFEFGHNTCLNFIICIFNPNGSKRYKKSCFCQGYWYQSTRVLTHQTIVRSLHSTLLEYDPLATLYSKAATREQPGPPVELWGALHIH